MCWDWQGIAAVLTSAAAVVGALGAIYGQVRTTHKLVNSRMDDLLESTTIAATKSGEIAGRNWRGNSPQNIGATPPSPD